jgi:hypothetical protein
MVCEAIDCPHPRYLDRYELDQDDLLDWECYFAWKTGAGSTPTDEDKADFLADARAEYGA